MKIGNIIGIMLVSFVLLWNTGCRKYPFIEGNSSVVTETRNSVSFNRVENQAEFSVYYIYDTVFRVVIEAESNLIPHIRTVVAGNTLEIDTHESLDNNYAMKIFVHAPTLNSVELSGSGLIDIDSLVSDNFEAVLSGSGSIYGNVEAGYFEAVLPGSGNINFYVNSVSTKAIVSGSGGIRLSGVSTNSEYIISGSGNIDAYGLPVVNSMVKISGSGNIYTTVSESLTGKISGSGNIFYRGNPNINVDITGSGSVIGD